MIQLLIILAPVLVLAAVYLLMRSTDTMVMRSVDKEMRKIPPQKSPQRDAFFRECLIAAKEGRFEHDYLTFHLKGTDEMQGFELTDTSWATGIQPYKPVNFRIDEFAFTKAQSDELAIYLKPLEKASLDKKYATAMRVLDGEEE